MKKYIASFLVGSMMSLAFGQTDSAAVSTETHQYNNMLSRTVNSGKTVQWSFNFLSIGASSFDENQTGNGSHVNKDRNPEHLDIEMGMDHFWMGVSSLSKTEGFDLKPAACLEFGFTWLTLSQWNRSHTFGVEGNLGISWTRYALKNNAVFYYPTVGQPMICEPLSDVDGRSYSNSRLTYASWRIPLRMCWQNRTHTHMFSLGAEAELRHHLRQRVKCANNKKRYLTAHDMDVNDWGCNVLASWGFKDFSFVARYGVTPFFDSSDLKGNPFMVGVMWDF